MQQNKTVTILLLIAFLMYLTVKQTQAEEDVAIKRESERFFGSLVFDEKGVPYYNYSVTGHPSVGLQGSPLAVATQASILYKQYQSTSNESAKKYFINNVDWLANTNMLKNNGSFSSYEYSFPWNIGDYVVEPYWRNAMANGKALSPLFKAYQLTGNSTYLDTVKNLLNSFFVDVKDGGVAYKTPNSGWWYEEYASRNSSKEPRVLNGMIHAILGINEYQKESNDTSAKMLFDLGILALKKDLPKYEYNGTSFYDRLGLPANSFYKSLHVNQLKELYDLTDEPIFFHYYERWNNYNLANSH